MPSTGAQRHAPWLMWPSRVVLTGYPGTSPLPSFQSVRVDLISGLLGRGTCCCLDLLSRLDWGKVPGLPCGAFKSEDQCEGYARC